MPAGLVALLRAHFARVIQRAAIFTDRRYNFIARPEVSHRVLTHVDTLVFELTVGVGVQSRMVCLRVVAIDGLLARALQRRALMATHPWDCLHQSAFLARADGGVMPLNLTQEEVRRGV